MELDSNLYLHDADRAAMNTLKSIPGFHQVMKAFMKIWNEQQYKLMNMSGNLKLSETQMGKYYDMLPPICEKLGIEVPEAYVTLDVECNAATYGDTNPFILINSGLFETIPDELIPTVLAHECGHIACHHTLYRTMYSIIVKMAAMNNSLLGSVSLYPILIAFYHWMRCSEYSADRAAMICDGTSEKTMEVCMRLAGYDKDINASVTLNEFMKQAEDYKALVNDSKWNKTLEFLMLQNATHPFTAVRAYEAREWGKSDRFNNILGYINSSPENKDMSLPVEIIPDKIIGKNNSDITTMLLSKGFVNVKNERLTECDKKAKDGEILSIEINGKKDCKQDFYKKDVDIVIEFFEPKTADEIAAEHPGEIQPLEGYKYFQGKETDIVTTMLEGAGFRTIEVKEMAIPKFGLLVKEDTVAKVIIGDNEKFGGEDWFDPETAVTIYSYVSVK